MTGSSSLDRLDAIRTAGVIAVLRAQTATAAIDAAHAIIRGGVTSIEVTYSIPGAHEVIRELRAQYGALVSVGAGTVTTPQQAHQAAEAGATYLVSPGTLPDLTRAMRETGRITVTGALTPSEVMCAVELGVDVVKIFPASLGGPEYIRALRGPFSGIPLMPTGGVTPENLPAWFAAGVVAVGAGGDLANTQSIEARDWNDLERRAKRYSEALKRARP